ncbi:MAG: MerR family transcriptional regulator [Alphaproteobacteria bacterium]
MTQASRRQCGAKIRPDLYDQRTFQRIRRHPPRALRFYEDKGLLAPRREGMNRIYGGRERARLQLILRGKRLGFPLNEIKGRARPLRP